MPSKSAFLRAARLMLIPLISLLLRSAVGPNKKPPDSIQPCGSFVWRLVRTPPDLMLLNVEAEAHN